MMMRRRIGNVVGLTIIIHAIATMQAMGDGGWAAAGVIVIGGSLLCLIYTIVPLGMLKQFARFSQLGDVDGSGDTDGVRFDDVQRSKGFYTPHYVCPLLMKHGKQIQVVQSRFSGGSGKSVSTPGQEAERVLKTVDKYVRIDGLEEGLRKDKLAKAAKVVGTFRVSTASEGSVSMMGSKAEVSASESSATRLDALAGTITDKIAFGVGEETSSDLAMDQINVALEFAADAVHDGAEKVGRVAEKAVYGANYDPDEAVAVIKKEANNLASALTKTASATAEALVSPFSPPGHSHELPPHGDSSAASKLATIGDVEANEPPAE